MSAPDHSSAPLGYWASVARSEQKLGFWFILPTFLLLLFIVVFPFIMQVYLSLTWWTPLDGDPWYMAYQGFQWFEQYWVAITDVRLWAALGRTILVMIVVVPAEFLFGLGLAYLFIDQFPGKKIFYSILLTPSLVVRLLTQVISQRARMRPGALAETGRLAPWEGWVTSSLDCKYGAGASGEARGIREVAENRANIWSGRRESNPRPTAWKS